MKLGEGRSETRLAEIEERIATLEARVEYLETRRGIEEEEPQDVPLAAGQAVDAEYWIGSKLLPRFGAVVVLVAIAFVAFIEASKSDEAVRGALLAAEAILCLAFIGVGEWKRGESEGFGYTLAAIGSTGLYVIAGGAHFAYGQLSATAMSSLFLALTLLNHAYAVWRDTRLFFLIGAAGGLAGSLYPLAQKDYRTALIVLTLATISGAAACGARRWLQLAIVGWFMGLLLLVPIIDSDHSRIELLMALYGGSLACILAASRSFVGWRFDPSAAGAAATLVATAAVGMLVAPGFSGSAQVVAFAIVGALASRSLPRSNPARRSLAIGSWIAAGLVAPWGLPAELATFGFVCLGVAAYALDRWSSSRVSAVFAVAEIGMAAIAYTRIVRELPAPQQHIHLASLAVGAAFAAAALRRAQWPWTSFAIAGAWILLSAWALLVEPSREAGSLAPYSTLVLATLAYALLLLAIGFRTRSPVTRLWSFAVMLGCLAEILASSAATTPTFRLAALLAVGAMMLFAGYRYVHERLRFESSERQGIERD